MFYSNETVNVPLNIRVLADENLRLNFTGLESFNAGTRIDLEDLQKNEIINIRDNSIYAFQATTNDEVHRFILHFNGIIS